MQRNDLISAMGKNRISLGKCSVLHSLNLYNKNVKHSSDTD